MRRGRSRSRRASASESSIGRRNCLPSSMRSRPARTGGHARLRLARGGCSRLARGDDDGAIRALTLALAEEGGCYPLERGRTLMALGTVHRHARRVRAAREVLGQADDLLTEIGAMAWRDKNEAELARQRSPLARRRTHRSGEARGPAGCRRSPQQGDRVDPLPERGDSRDAPVPRLPQARGAIAHRTRRSPSPTTDDAAKQHGSRPGTASGGPSSA